MCRNAVPEPTRLPTHLSSNYHMGGGSCPSWLVARDGSAPPWPRRTKPIRRFPLSSLRKGLLSPGLLRTGGLNLQGMLGPRRTRTAVSCSTDNLARGLHPSARCSDEHLSWWLQDLGGARRYGLGWLGRVMGRWREKKGGGDGPPPSSGTRSCSALLPPTTAALLPPPAGHHVVLFSSARVLEQRRGTKGGRR